MLCHWGANRAVRTTNTRLEQVPTRSPWGWRRPLGLLSLRLVSCQRVAPLSHSFGKVGPLASAQLGTVGPRPKSADVGKHPVGGCFLLTLWGQGMYSYRCEVVCSSRAVGLGRCQRPSEQVREGNRQLRTRLHRKAGVRPFFRGCALGLLLSSSAHAAPTPTPLHKIPAVEVDPSLPAHTRYLEGSLSTGHSKGRSYTPLPDTGPPTSCVGDSCLVIFCIRMEIQIVYISGYNLTQLCFVARMLQLF